MATAAVGVRLPLRAPPLESCSQKLQLSSILPIDSPPGRGQPQPGRAGHAWGQNRCARARLPAHARRSRETSRDGLAPPPFAWRATRGRPHASVGRTMASPCGAVQLALAWRTAPERSAFPPDGRVARTGGADPRIATAWDARRSPPRGPSGWPPPADHTWTARPSDRCPAAGSIHTTRRFQDRLASEVPPRGPPGGPVTGPRTDSPFRVAETATAPLPVGLAPTPDATPQGRPCAVYRPASAASRRSHVVGFKHSPHKSKRCRRIRRPCRAATSACRRSISSSSNSKMCPQVSQIK